MSRACYPAWLGWGLQGRSYQALYPLLLKSSALHLEWLNVNVCVYEGKLKFFILFISIILHNKKISLFSFSSHL